MMNYARVFLGAFLGGVIRSALGNVLNQKYRYFPIGTFLANMLGVIALGILIRMMQISYFGSTEFYLLFATGFCGGLTTFSTFAFEVVDLFIAGRKKEAIIYSSSTVVLGMVLMGVCYGLILL